MAGSADIVVTVVEGGTSNSNVSSNNNINQSTSVSENHSVSHNTSVDTSNVTSNNTSDSTNHNFSESTSNDTSFVTSNTTSNNTTRSYSESTSNDNSVSNSTSHNTSVSSANNVSYSESDITVSLNNIVASNYKADRDLEGVGVHESAETGRLNLKLAFANEKFQAVLPLLGSVVGSGSGSSGSGNPIGFQASLRPIGFQSPQIENDYTAHGNEGFGYYSRRTSMVDTGNYFRMGAGDVKTGGIGFANGASVADAVAATVLPYIRTCGVLTPAQVQASISAATARNDTRTQSEIRKLTGDLSGRGFSTNSPILAALRVGLAAQNLRANMEGTLQLQLSTAKENSESIFNGQKAVSEQYIQQEGVLVEHERNEVTRSVGVLSAVAQMVASAL